MQVALIKKVKNLGNAGDVKEVARGYATNFLIPQGLALPARGGFLKEAKDRTRKSVVLEKSDLENTKKIIAEINGSELKIKQKANTSGVLFAAIRAFQISELIAKKLSKSIDEKYIILEEPIKKLGEYNVEIKAEDVGGKIKVGVEGE